MTIRRAARRRFSAEDNNRIVLEGLRGDASIADLCRKEGTAHSLYCTWSKELEAGKRRFAIDTSRAATTDVTDTLDMALATSDCAEANVPHRRRLLADNGPSYSNKRQNLAAVTAQGLETGWDLTNHIYGFANFAALTGFKVSAILRAVADLTMAENNGLSYIFDLAAANESRGHLGASRIKLIPDSAAAIALGKGLKGAEIENRFTEGIVEAMTALRLLHRTTTSSKSLVRTA